MVQYNSISLTETHEEVDKDVDAIIIRMAELIKTVCEDSGHSVAPLDARLKAATFLFWNGLEEE